MSSVSVYITLYNYVSTYIKADVRWYKAPEYHITWCLNYQLFARPSSVCNVASARKGVFQHPFTQWPKRVCISAGIGHFCWSERSGTTNLARFFLVSPLPKSFLSPIKAPILSSGRFIFVWFFSISVGVFYHPRSSRPRSLQAGISTALHSRWLFLGSQDDGSGEKSPSEVRSTIWLWLT